MDREKISQIYSKERRFMINTALRMGVPVDDCEDIVQDATIRMMEQRKIPEKEKGFVYMQTKNTAIDHFLHEKRQKRDKGKTVYLDLNIPLHHPVAPSAEREALAHIELKEVVKTAPCEVLLTAEGYTSEEAGEILGELPTMVRNRVDRWRKKNAG